MRSRVLMMIFVAALAVSSLGIYLIEGGQGAPFDDLFNGVWWSFVTFTTVGYGDMSPATVPGKLFGIIVLLGGVFINSVVISLVSNWVFEYRSSQARGISDIDESEHALVCSDDPAFIRSVVGELRAKPVPTTPVVIFPGNENPLLTTDGSSPDWVSGPATSGEVLRKANVKRAAQAYVAYRDASQTVMTVMQIEALTDRRVQSLALYADRGFRVHLNDAGVDYALNVDRLYVPLMVQSFVNQGAPAWLRQLILETPDSAAMRTRRLAAGTWGDYFARRANDDEVPVGVLRGEELIPNPGWDFAVQDGDQALLMVGPEDRSAGSYFGSTFRGVAEIPEDGPVVVISDLRGFLETALEELAASREVTEVNVLSPLQPFADLPEGLRVNWHRGPVMSPSGLHAAGADRARVVLIDNDADSHTLMTVLRLEKITGGSVFTVAAYDEPGFDSLLMSAGCDFAINEDELAGPVLVQAGSNNGYGELLEAMISQDGSTQSVFCRVLGEGWSSQPWGDARTMLKQEHGVVALGLISEDGKQLTTWPKRDQAAAPGQRLLFLAQGDADLPTFLGA